MNVPRKSMVEEGHAPDPDRDARWELAKRIVRSQAFGKSNRLAQFLLYVCEQVIAGNESSINEQQIGVHVFGREPGYNSSDDSIVRSQARLLRARLDAYFQGEGKDERLRISVPKGTYVPRFERAEVAHILVDVPEAAPAEPKRAPPFLSRYGIPGLVALVLALSVLVAVVHVARARTSLTTVFWSQVFHQARPTIIIPSDCALVLLQNSTHKRVDLATYLSRNYALILESAKFPSTPESYRYTGAADLVFSSRLSRLREAAPDRTSIRFARDVRMEDLRGSNLVIIGARRANPWVELFDKKNTFQGLFNEEAGDFVLNRTPQKSESSVYTHRSTGDQNNHEYAVISLVSGLTGDESVLMEGGMSQVGTEAAADFLFSQAFESFLSKAVDQDHIRSFEILLEIATVGGSAPQTDIVAFRIH